MEKGEKSNAGKNSKISATKEVRREPDVHVQEICQVSVSSDFPIIIGKTKLASGKWRFGAVYKSAPKGKIPKFMGFAAQKMGQKFMANIGEQSYIGSLGFYPIYGYVEKGEIQAFTVQIS
jgi:hypothetical protein